MRNIHIYFKDYKGLLPSSGMPQDMVSGFMHGKPYPLYPLIDKGLLASAMPCGCPCNHILWRQTNPAGESFRCPSSVTFVGKSRVTGYSAPLPSMLRHVARPSQCKALRPVWVTWCDGWAVAVGGRRVVMHPKPQGTALLSPCSGQFAVNGCCAHIMRVQRFGSGRQARGLGGAAA